MSELAQQGAGKRAARKKRTRIPVSAGFAGYAGLIPFAGTAFLVWFNWPGQAAQDALTALHLYAAIILSFLGGARFGFVTRRYGLPETEEETRALRSGILIAVLPALAAWAALLLSPAAALATLILCYIAQFFADWQAGRAGDAPPWYGALRFPLTLFALAAMAAALLRVTA